MNTKLWLGVAGICGLVAGCGGDFSLPEGRPRAPLSGSVMSTRDVAVSWVRADRGGAPLCVDVCATRACEATRRHTEALGAHLSEYVIPRGHLFDGPAVFWRVRDCHVLDAASLVHVPVWQFFVPRLGAAGPATVLAMSTDLDGDSLPDLVYQSGDDAPRARVVRANAVTGWRGSVLSIAPPADARDASLRFTVAGDLDGNGFADMLVIGRRVEVLLGGVGPELEDLLPALPALPEGADVIGGRDLDLDGRGDVVIAAPGVLRVCHMADNGDAREGAVLRCDDERAPGASASRVFVRMLPDLDGDAAPELALGVVGGPDGGTLQVRRSATRQWAPLATGLDGRIVASLGDLDGDGRGDLAWSVGLSELEVVMWPGGAMRSHRLTVPGRLDGVIQDVAAGDFDGDGSRDIAVTWTQPSYGLRLHVYFDARGDGREVALTSEDVGAPSDVSILGADDDGDGVADLFLRTRSGALRRLMLPRASPDEDAPPAPIPPGEPRTPEPERPIAPTRGAVEVSLKPGTCPAGGMQSVDWTCSDCGNKLLTTLASR